MTVPRRDDVSASTVAAPGGTHDWRPLLVSLLALVYLPFIPGGFLTDDFVHLVRLDASGGAALLTSPDAFGFFRPLTQLSLALDATLFGDLAAAYRLESIALHGCVLAAAWLLARMLLRPAGAVAAALAFALTPKAAPIAVLWISARGELLMTLFALLAAIAWIKWQRGSGARWLLGAVACYVFALASKETAVLLPAVLLAASLAANGPATPEGNRHLSALPSAAATAGALGFAVAAGVAMLVWRTHAGALLPTTADPHYSLLTPLFRWLRNGRNYFERMLPVPVTLALLAVAAAWRQRRRDALARPRRRPPAAVMLFGAVWLAVFLMPVLPVLARNELYLYAPVFGMCLWCGAAVDWCAASITRRAWQVIVTVVIVGFGAYQGLRARELRDEFIFSKRFVDAIRSSPDIAGAGGFVAIEPVDAPTARALRDAIGGYLDVILRHVHGPAASGAIDYGDAALPEATLRLGARYSAGDVQLFRAAPGLH